MALTVNVTTTTGEAVYCSYTDIENSIEDLEALAEKSAPTGTTAANWVTAQIVFAQNHIDGRLGSRYLVPFTAPINPIIKEICRLIAVHNCLNPNFVGAMPDGNSAVSTPFAQANALLEMIENGTISLAGATAASEPIGDIVVSSTSVTRDFTQTKYDSSGVAISVGSMEGL